MKPTDYRAEQRAAESACRMVYTTAGAPLGRAVKFPSGATYARTPAGILRRIDKVKATKKARRAARRALKALEVSDVEAIQQTL